jgi:hypothetical protein
MKTFTQSFTRSTNNATQHLLSLIYAALSFTREGTFQRAAGGFLVPSNYALVRVNSVHPASYPARREPLSVQNHFFRFSSKEF